MKKQIIWSNMNLNVDDWKDDYKEYLEINGLDDHDPNDEDDIYEWMVETNGMYWDDARINLDKQLDGRILVIADLGLWNGRTQGYKILSSRNLNGIISSTDDAFEVYGAVTEDLLIAAVIGGALIGSALALVFKASATTGGADIIVKVLRTKWKHIKTNTLFLVFDSIVIIASWIVFHDLTVAFYAGVAVVTTSAVMDRILYGSDEARLTYIISSNPEQMKQRILDELEITATIITARGAYSNAPRELLMIAVRKQMYPKLEEIVKDEDVSAFMIVSSANEIYGEGYKDITKEKI